VLQPHQSRRHAEPLSQHVLSEDANAAVIAAAVVPGTEILQLFYQGTDNSVLTRWRDRNGSWSTEQSLGGQMADSNVSVSVVPGTQVLQLFYRGADGAVWSRWRNPNGSWSAEQNLGGAVAGGLAVAIVP
jgi:hypothetical protein